MSHSQQPIVVVGSINIDLVAKAERIPVSGETVRGIEFKTHSGGKGANQAVAIARLGYPVHMIGKVGNDAFGEQLQSGLQQAGVDVSAVEQVEDSSGVAVIVVSPEGDNVIVVTPGANAALRPMDLDANVELIRNAKIVLTQLETPMETVEHLAELCEREGVPLMLDPAPSQSLSPAVMRRVTWFTPNQTEALFYAKCPAKESPETIAGRLLQEGPAGVALKLGSSGVYLRNRDDLDVMVPAFSVKAVDTTAAGDAFNGAFAVGLALGHSPKKSARFAAAAAAISVTRAGAQSSMPTFVEVARMLDDAHASRIQTSGA
jgi:ribokinase